ncbi:MAG: hypothetical protein WCG51_08060, partial [Elusimicrobiota bacterium]
LKLIVGYSYSFRIGNICRGLAPRGLLTDLGRSFGVISVKYQPLTRAYGTNLAQAAKVLRFILNAKLIVNSTEVE